MLDSLKAIWKKIESNNFFKFVVGAALIFVAINWLLSGSLVGAMHEFLHPPSKEGEGMQVVPPGAGLESIAMLLIGLTISLGGWFLTQVDWIAGLIARLAGSQSPSGNATTTADTSSASAAEPNADDVMRDLLIQLGDAVQSNDLVKAAELQWKIRRPQALEQLVNAYDTDRAVWAATFDELEKNWSNNE